MIAATLSATCSLCGRKDVLDTQGFRTREEVARRYHGEMRDGQYVCEKCCITPPSQSFDLHALDSALDR